MDAWKVKSLEELCELHNGLWKGEKPPFVRATVIRNTNFAQNGLLDLTDVAVLDVEQKKLASRTLRHGDIILEKSGGGPKQPVGRVALFVQEGGVYSFSNFTSALRVRDQAEVDYSFLHKYLHWVYVSGVTEGMQSHSTGIRNLDGKAYKGINIKYPPLTEQRRIVSILDEVFKGIDKAVANTEKNLANAKQLFAAFLSGLFFSPTDGWIRTTVGDQLHLQRGFDITKKDQRTGDIPVYSSGGPKSLHDAAMADGPGVIVGRKGSIGSVHFSDGPYWPHDTTLWVKDFKGNNPRLAYFLFKALPLSSLDSGAANPALNRNIVHPIPIFWPSPELQASLVLNLNAVEVATLRLEAICRQKMQLLAEYKKSLLDAAFSGQLVCDKAVAEAAE